MAKTAAELLSPRFEVIADYPKNEFKKGEILVRIKYATNDIYHTNEFARVGGLYFSELEAYPHLFRKMNWWEARKEEDMPSKLMSLADEKQDTFEIVGWDMDILVGWVDKNKRSCCSLLTWNPEYGYIPVD